jgi:hypothetical protein
LLGLLGKGNGAAPRGRKLEDDPRVNDFMARQFHVALGTQSLPPGQLIYRIAKGARLCRISEAGRWLKRFVKDGLIVTEENGLVRWKGPPHSDG